MKKIYMILAAMTLLSMSLNAQILLTGWDCATDAQNFPSSWTVPSVGGSGDFTNSYWFSGSSGGTFTIPATALQGNSTVTVKIVAGKENSNTHTISVNGDSKGLTQALVEYVWENVSATNGLTITYSDYYVDISSIKVYATITDPTIMASPSSINMNAAPGGTSTETVTVAGYNLTEGITATISGTNAALFSVTPASLGTTGGDLTITYSPSAVGNHSATLTLTSAGAESVTINLTGSCIAGTTYELVTDPLTQLVDGKKYIIVHGNYAMGALNTSGYGTLVGITDNGDNTVTVPGTASPMVLTLGTYSSSYTSGYSFQLENGSYLRGTSSYGSYSLTTVATANDYCSWTTVADVKSTGGYGIKMTYNYDSYRIGYRENGNYSNFGFYSTSNLTANSTSYFYGLLYVEVDDTPVLTAPVDGTTVNVGTLEEGGETSVSVTIPVTGRNLTEDVTVSVSGTGFTVSPTTLSADAVNAGNATVTVTYTGTANGTGTLTLSCDDLDEDVTVNLSATYIAHDPFLTAPVDGTTVDVGTNNGMGVSKTIAVSGTYLTEDLTVSVSGAGFTVSPTTLSADAVNNGTATVTVTYNGTTDATGTLTISSGEVSTTVNLTGSYSTGIAPTAHGMVRMGTLRIVDQFAEKIPATNDHPYRYTYFLKLATRDTTSSPARVPVQHTGAEMNGYYTHAEMKGDTDPANFLTEDMLSAEVDMNLSPSSAPYFYTINSVKNGVPASVTEDEHYDSYISVMQRREAGDYQDMQYGSPYLNRIKPAGKYDFFDYRAIQAESKDDSLSYVPIVWTKGIDRHYYVDDSLHNSYGAPIWEVRTGDVMIDQSGTVCQKQARQDANGNWVWNNSVNYTLDGTDYCLYFVSVDAQGILPVGNVEYEPYMFRLWLVDSTASLRNYTWELNDKGKPVKIVDAGAYTENGGMWKLLDTKMCENWHGQDGKDFDPDLNYVVSIVDGNAENHSWDENIAFVGPMNGFNPKLYVRFYYKIKGSVDPTSGMRGDGDDDNVGYVVLRGVNPDPSTAVHEIVITGEVESQTFYNVQGMQSDKPFEGINIVVTRYSNGATTTTKVRY